MLGFILGTVCLFALISTLRMRHHHYGYGYAGPYGGGCGGGYGSHGGHGYGHGGFGHGYGMHRGRRGLMRAVFERLDTTPGQEKAIVSAVETLQDRMRELRTGLGSARTDIAAAIEGETFDRARVDGAFAQGGRAMEEGRAALTQALASIHAALDERQRKQLASLISEGSFGRGFGRGAC